MIKFISFFNNYGELVAMAAILAVVLYFCLRDFNAFSKRSWVLLIGVTFLGGFLLFRGWKRRRLRKELLEREDKLKEMEKRYKALREQNKIAEENYQDALIKLEEAKKVAAMKILAADEEYERRIKELEKEYANMNSQELVDRIDQILSSN